jgi:hypothetical protein
LSGVKAYGQSIEKFGVKPDFFTGGSSSNIWNTVNAEGNLPYMTPSGSSTYEKSEANVNFTGSGLSPKIPLGEAFNKIKEEMFLIKEAGSRLTANVGFYGEGSTKKPIMDKIQEIVNAFGGIEEAASALEANINFTAISAEITKLEYKMKTMEQAVPGISDVVQQTESGWWINPTAPLWAQQYAANTVLDLKSQMAQLQGQAAISNLQMQGYQSGIQYVPKTGPAMLHEGERVISKKVSMGDIHIHVNGGQDIVKVLTKTLKYNLSNELKRLL